MIFVVMCIIMLQNYTVFLVLRATIENKSVLIKFNTYMQNFFQLR